MEMCFIALWTTLVLPQTGINTIAAHPQNEGQLYALYRNENPYISTDGGLTWEREVAEGPGGDELYFDHEQGETMYLICDTGGGAARSTDGGWHWDSCADIPSGDWFASGC